MMIQIAAMTERRKRKLQSTLTTSGAMWQLIGKRDALMNVTNRNRPSGIRKMERELPKERPG